MLWFSTLLLAALPQAAELPFSMDLPADYLAFSVPQGQQSVWVSSRADGKARFELRHYQVAVAGASSEGGGQRRWYGRGGWCYEHQTAELFVHSLNLHIRALLVADSPSVLSVGKLARENCIKYVWVPTENSSDFVTPTGKQVFLDTAVDVPYVAPHVVVSGVALATAAPTPVVSNPGPASNSEAIFTITLLKQRKHNKNMI